MKQKVPSKGRTPVLDVLVADDHEIVRLGLHTLLKEYPGLRVCGETSTAAETMKKVKELQPHILLLKLDLPDKGALELIPELLKLWPGLKILLFAAEGSWATAQRAVLTPTAAKQALKEGALGLVLKPDVQDIRLALDALSANKSFISSNIFESMTSEPRYRTEHLPSMGNLTAREAQVLKLIAAGKVTKEIAADLGISPRTVEVYRANILHKFGLHSQADLILFALQQGVIELPVSTKTSH